MKKFLTVLLALSVVFTYSFSSIGSVFAAETKYTPAEFEAALDNVVDGYESTLKGNITRVKALYSYDEDGFTTVDGVKVSAEAVAEGIDAFIAELVEDMEKVVEDAVDNDKESYTTDDYTSTVALIKAVIEKNGEIAEKKDYVEKAVSRPDNVSEYYVSIGNNTLVPAKGFAVENIIYWKLDRIVANADGDIVNTTAFVAVEKSSVENEYELIKNPADVDLNDGRIYYNMTQVKDINLGTEVNGYYEKAENGYVLTADKYASADTSKKYYEFTTVQNAVPGKDLTDVEDFRDALNATAHIVKAEAPKAESYYAEKVNTELDESKYSENKETFKVTIDGREETLTAQEFVSYEKEKALDAIKAAKKALTDKKTPVKADYEAAIKAYEKAYTDAVDALEDVKTNEEIAGEEAEKVIDVAAAVAKLKAYAVGPYYTAMKVAKDGDITGWADAFGDNIYVANADKTATVFGVKVANPAKITASEAKALNSALYDAIGNAVSVAEVTLSGVEKDADADSYVAALNAKLAELYNAAEGQESVFSETVADAAVIADVYQEVVDYGAKLKNIYKFGEKIYDDEKVDKVVKAAEAIVYANLGNLDAAKDASVYFAEAIKAVYGKNATEEDLELEKSDALADFEKAQQNAIDKFDKPIVNYGENKTPEADKKYKSSIYVRGAVTADDETWTNIRDNAVKAINAAQSYADIDAAMAAAEAKLAQLLTKENEEVIENLRDSYQSALDAYKLEKTAFLDMSKYDSTDFAEAVTKGKALIEKAGTEETLEAAFEKAKALVDAVKETEAIDVEKAALEEMIKALPLASKVTLEDKADIEAARAAYDAYTDIPGVPAVSAARLTTAENALADLEKEAIEKELTALEKEIKAIGDVDDDKAAEAAVALKEKAEELQAKIDAHNEKVSDLGLANKEIRKSTALEDFLGMDLDKAAYGAEIYLVRKAIAAISDKVGEADPTAVKEAKKMFDALTDKQQYILDSKGYADRLAAALANIAVQVESLKIKVSTKLYTASNKIRVNWKATGIVDAADGYQVYKSTKAQKNYKFMGKTKKSYMDNKKNLKKGSRYYYKVRAYVDIDGERYYSDWSNKGNRIYR